MGTTAELYITKADNWTPAKATEAAAVFVKDLGQKMIEDANLDPNQALTLVTAVTVLLEGLENALQRDVDAMRSAARWTAAYDNAHADDLRAAADRLAPRDTD